MKKSLYTTPLLFLILFYQELLAQVVYIEDKFSVSDTVFVNNPIFISYNGSNRKIVIDKNAAFCKVLSLIDTNNVEKSFKKIIRKYHTMDYLSYGDLNTHLWFANSHINFTKPKKNNIHDESIGKFRVTQTDSNYAVIFKIKKKYYNKIILREPICNNKLLRFWYSSSLYRKSRFGNYKYAILVGGIIPAKVIPDISE